jgi:ArsR family transcriptional regulator
MIFQPVEFSKSLGDPTRLRIMVLLTREGELCVCELTHVLGEIQPKVSRHLALLRESGTVLDRRQGQWIYYRLNPNLPAWASDVLKTTVAGISSRAPFSSDHKALGKMSDRPDNVCSA